jgi:fucose permease
MLEGTNGRRYLGLDDEPQGTRDPLLKDDNVVESYTTLEASPDSTSDEESLHAYDEKKESWNNPRENIAKLLITFFGFTLMGLTDAAIGALLPSLEEHYDVDDVQVSFALLVPVCGFLLSTVICTWSHYKLGRGGVSILGICCQLSNYCVAISNPPYWALLTFFAIGGLGSGLMNGSWNAWVGAFNDSHSVLGVLQGFYALGGILGPAIFTWLISHKMVWYTYYRMLALYAFILLIAAIIVFHKDGPSAYISKLEEDDEKGSQKEDSSGSSATMEALRTREVWLLSLLLYSYQGTEMSLSDWVVTYMIRVRNGDPRYMGLISSCLWTGLTAGRIGLGFVTGRFKNHKRVITIYLLCAIVSHLIFWASSDLIMSAVSILFVGFFTGPMFPSAMILTTQILPKRLHVPGICASTGLSGVGSATFPVMIGALLDRLGASVLQPVLCLFLFVLTGLWIALPSKRRIS